MIRKTYKDLAAGDKVKYKDIYIHDKMRISGTGTVENICSNPGFYTTVWVRGEDGALKGVPIEKVRKI